MLDSSSLNSISWQVSFAFVTHLFEKKNIFMNN